MSYVRQNSILKYHESFVVYIICILHAIRGGSLELIHYNTQLSVCQPKHNWTLITLLPCFLSYWDNNYFWQMLYYLLVKKACEKIHLGKRKMEKILYINFITCNFNKLLKRYWVLKGFFYDVVDPSVPKGVDWPALINWQRLYKFNLKIWCQSNIWMLWHNVKIYNLWFRIYFLP